MKYSNYIYLAIFTLLLSACTNQVKEAGTINRKASLPADFNFEGLGLKVMASFINKRSGTMSTLYANGQALQNAVSGIKIHSAGEVFALITWKQQLDKRWFGAKMPGELSTVEWVRSSESNNRTMFTYEKREGQTLVPVTDTLGRQARIGYILAQQPSVMP